MPVTFNQNDFLMAVTQDPATAKPIPVVEAVNAGQNQNLTLSATTAAWLATDVANTAKTITITFPTILQQEGLYLVTVNNTSTESSLTVIVQNQETLNGTTRFPELTRFGVGASLPDGKSVVVQGMCLTAGSRLVISNDTALTTAFTIGIAVRKV